MVLTLNPAVSGVTHRRLLAQILIFGTAAWVAAVGVIVLLSAVASAFAALLGWTAVVVALAVAVAFVATKDFGIPLRLPYRNDQVPEWFRRYLSPEVTAAVYGAMLGTGFLTLYTSSLHLAFLAAGATKGIPFVLLICGAFAIGKILVFAAMPLNSPPGQFEEHFDRNFGRNFQKVRLAQFAAGTLSLVVASLLAASVLFS